LTSFGTAVFFDEAAYILEIDTSFVNKFSISAALLGKLICKTILQNY